MMDIVELDEVTLGSMVSACATFVLQREGRQILALVSGISDLIKYHIG